MSRKHIENFLKENNIIYEKNHAVFNTSEKGDTVLHFKYYLPEYNALIETPCEDLDIKSLFCVQKQYKLITIDFSDKNKIYKHLSDWIAYWSGASKNIPMKNML